MKFGGANMELHQLYKNVTAAGGYEAGQVFWLHLMPAAECPSLNSLKDGLPLRAQSHGHTNMSCAQVLVLDEHVLRSGTWTFPRQNTHYLSAEHVWVLGRS